VCRSPLKHTSSIMLFQVSAVVRYLQFGGLSRQYGVNMKAEEHLCAHWSHFHSILRGETTKLKLAHPSKHLEKRKGGRVSEGICTTNTPLF